MDHLNSDERFVINRSKSYRRRRIIIITSLILLFIAIATSLSVFLGFHFYKKHNAKPSETGLDAYLNEPTKLPDLENTKPKDLSDDKIKLENKIAEPSDGKNSNIDTPTNTDLNENAPVPKNDYNEQGVVDNDSVVKDVVEPKKLNDGSDSGENKPNDVPENTEPVDQTPKPTDKVENVVQPNPDEKKVMVIAPKTDDETNNVVKQDEVPKDTVTEPKKEDKKENVVQPNEVPKNPVEKPETDDVKSDEELRKEVEKRMKEEKRKAKEDKAFRDELNRLFKIRQERALEEARRIRERKELRKITDDYSKPQRMVPEGLDKEAIFEKLERYAPALNLKIIKGTFENCMLGKCEKLKSNFVYEWELRLASEMLYEAKKAIDLEKEYKSIGEYRDYVKRHSKFIATKEWFKECYGNYKKNVEKVEKHNKDPNRLYNMEINALADLGSDISQITESKMGKRERLSGSSNDNRNLRNQEIHVDWRKKGVIQPVIHQGSCGSCWAIAATDAYNAFAAIKQKDKTRYSPQQLVDCVSPKYSCNKGGSQTKALNYIIENKLCSFAEYKYTGTKTQCSAYRCEHETGVKSIVHLKDKDALEFLKTNGPFVTLFHISNDFMLYGDGIFNGSCQAKDAHSVVVVGHGYDTDKGKNYWIVKNSWGEDWGEAGYIRMLDESSVDKGVKTQYCDFLKHSEGIV